MPLQIITTDQTLGAGTTNAYWLVEADGLTIRGANMYSTVLRTDSANAPIYGSFASTYYSARRLHISDLTLDANNMAASAATIYSMLDEVIFERVRFTGFVDSGAALSDVSKATFIDCEFFQPGNNTGAGIKLARCRNVSIVRCVFKWLTVGVQIDADGVPAPGPSDRIAIEGCTFYFDYWAGKVLVNTSAQTVAGEGLSVGYGTTTLTDGAADFTLFTDLQYSGKGARPVRVLSELTSGTVPGQQLAIRFTDPSKNFTTLGASFGDIVRCGTKWAMVNSTNGTSLELADGWFDSSTYEPVDPPSSGSYSLRRLTLGRIVGRTTTILTVERWYRLDGSTAPTPTPSLTTRYEVLLNATSGLHSGALLAELNSTVTLSNCYSRGCLADQFTLGGADSRAISCVSEYGRDMGITVNGRRGVVIGGRFDRNGAGGISVNGEDIRIVGVTAQGNNTESFPVPNTACGELITYGSKRLHIASSVFDKSGGQAPNGIRLRVLSTDTFVTDSTDIGHAKPLLADSDSVPSTVSGCSGIADQHGSKAAMVGAGSFRVSGPASIFAAGTVPELNLYEWYFSASPTGIIVAPVELPVGTRIRTIAWLFNKGGSATALAMRLRKRTGSTTTTLHTTSDVSSSATWVTVTTATIDYVVEADYQIWLEVQGGNAAHKYASANVTFDRPAPP